jgi:hypothetical protein
MTEERKFSRIKYVVGGKLQFHDITFLENLSMGGALVTIRNTSITDIRGGDNCLLRLYHEIEGCHVIVKAMVARQGFAFVGLAFSDLDADTIASLGKIKEREKRNILGLEVAA